MGQPSPRRAGRWFWLLTAALPLSLAFAGCSVLTDAQVGAVHQFAHATKGFSASPAAVMEAYATVRGERGVLVASTMSDPTSALKTLEEGVRQEERLRKQASEATAALRVLDNYSDLLTVLSSDKFTDELKNQSLALGAALDQDVATLNKLTNGSTRSFGDLVAGIVRAGGGILIRHVQQRALYEAVTNAQGVVIQATRSVEDLMAVYVTPPDSNLFTRESQEIEETFPLMQSVATHRWDLPTLDRVQSALRSSERGLALAKACAAAAARYRQAHAKLVEAITKGSDPSSLIAEINALAQQIRAGEEVREELRRKSG